MKGKATHPKMKQQKTKQKKKDIMQQLTHEVKIFADAAMATANSSENGLDFFITKLRQFVPFVSDPCPPSQQSLGWCTPPGSTRQQMTECACLRGPQPCDFSPDQAIPPGQPIWESAAQVFGKMGQIL